MYKNQRQLSQKHVIILHNCAAHAYNLISDSLSHNIPCYSHLKRVSGGQKKSKNHQPGAAARCTQVQLTMWPMSMGPAQTRPGQVGGPDQTSGLISFHWDAHVSANLTQWVGKRHKHSTHNNTHTQRHIHTVHFLYVGGHWPETNPDTDVDADTYSACSSFRFASYALQGFADCTHRCQAASTCECMSVHVCACLCECVHALV